MQKKRKRERRKKSKFFRKLIVFLGLIIVLFLSGTIIYYLFEDNIHNIYVNGNTYLTDQEVIELGKLENYPKFFSTTTFKIKDNILKSPYIKEVKVRKNLFYVVDITVEEYERLFYRLDTNKLVLQNKKEIDYKNDDIDIPILINYVPDKKYNSFIEKFSKIDSSVRDKVSEIEYSPTEFDEDRFILYMNDKNYVYITLTKLNVLNKYNEAITKLEGKVGNLYLDSGNYFQFR